MTCREEPATTQPEPRTRRAPSLHHQRRRDRGERPCDRALAGIGVRSRQHELTAVVWHRRDVPAARQVHLRGDLVHETQHLKLCALLDLVALTLPDDDQRYYAPWRADPGLASGLSQDAYAFFGVSGVRCGQRQVAPELALRQRAKAEFARWREGAALVVDTLMSSGQLATAG
jgi:hypothetical protein